MIYSLKCGECLEDSNVSGDTDPILWVCSCGNENCTSLPLKTDGTLVTDASKADAILTPAEAKVAVDIITGEPL